MIFLHENESFMFKSKEPKKQNTCSDMKQFLYKIELCDFVKKSTDEFIIEKKMKNYFVLNILQFFFTWAYLEHSGY